MDSSYSENSFGKVFYGIVLEKVPSLVLEFGVLHGYSTIHIATALKYNHIILGKLSNFIAYDLWNDYSYKHGNISNVLKLINNLDLEKYVKLRRGNFFISYKEVKESSVDLIHVDISNDGNTLKFLMKNWDSKIKKNGIILFEGGSEERDKIDWMIKYNKKPIKEVLKEDPIIKDNYNVIVLSDFPSLTILTKKGE